MIKSILVSVLLLAFVISGHAQPQVLNSSSRTFRATVNLAAGQLSDQQLSAGTATSDLEDLSLQLRNGDIIVSYRLKNPDDREDFYLTALTATLNGVPLPAAPEFLSGDVGTPLTSGGQRQITWSGLLEKYVNLEGELTITLTAERWGELQLPVDCDNPPSFTSKQRVPYYIAAGLGAAAIGIGQIFRAQRDDKYQEYENTRNYDAATPIYNDANSKHHTYLILTYAGAGIIVADAVLYIIRQSRYKKKLRLYQEFCNQSNLTLAPEVEIPMSQAIGPSQGKIGFRLTYSF